jgi:2-keto-4-pentenoate hydratase/2-oxohepta-3-ene-1,7-dioic acid hydratase in catechol pathway
MKLVRFGRLGKEKPGILLPDNTRLDVSAFGQDFNEDFFENKGLQKLAAWLKKHQPECPVVNRLARWGAPIGRPSKIVCIGLNYADHAKESGMQIPPEPVVFFKATTAICGPFDEVVIPKNSQKLDWEVELAVVIGKRASYVSESDAMDYVAGYVLHNDLSEREFQLERSGQWVKGKSADTFAPLGPVLTTKDEIADPHNLDLWLKVNGELLQNSNTRQLVYGVPFLISYLSHFMTLLPGDVISTGTPPGVGLGFNPPRYLKPGDEMELSVAGLGVAKQKVVSWQSKV